MSQTLHCTQEISDMNYQSRRTEYMRINILDLPSEVRDMIYDYTILQFRKDHRKMPELWPLPRRRWMSLDSAYGPWVLGCPKSKEMRFPLLLANKQVNYEYNELLRRARLGNSRSTLHVSMGPEFASVAREFFRQGEGEGQQLFLPINRERYRDRPFLRAITKYPNLSLCIDLWRAMKDRTCKVTRSLLEIWGRGRGKHQQPNPSSAGDGKTLKHFVYMITGYRNLNLWVDLSRATPDNFVAFTRELSAFFDIAHDHVKKQPKTFYIFFIDSYFENGFPNTYLEDEHQHKRSSRRMMDAREIGLSLEGWSDLLAAWVRKLQSDGVSTRILWAAYWRGYGIPLEEAVKLGEDVKCSDVDR